MHRASVPATIALAVLAAFALAGCGGGGEEQPSPAQIVERSVEATAAERAFHFVYDEKDGPSAPKGLHLTFAEGDVIVPDKVKANVSGVFLGLPLSSELVGIGHTAYVKNPLSERWQKVIVETNPVPFFDPDTGVLSVIRRAEDVEAVGSERVAGVDAYHLRGSVPVSAITPMLGNPPSSRLVGLELWVDKESDRLVRLRLSGRVQDGDSDTTERTIEITDYGVVVPIVAPKT